MQRLITLDLNEYGPDPPSEFRIFTAGVVRTLKGDFVFGEKEMAAVLADVARRGVELPIDYDHAMVDPASSREERAAAGWFSVADRGGELWAVGVRWTECGDEDVRSKEWRYISPAFDAKGKSITNLINVALTNIPATLEATPLTLAREVDTMSLITLTGADSEENAVAVALAWKASHERLPRVEQERADVAAELASLRASVETERKSVLLNKLSDDGKLTPAMRPFIETLSVAQIETFAQTAPVVLSREPLSPPAHASNEATADVFEGKTVPELAKSNDWQLLHKLSRENSNLFATVMAARKEVK